MSGLTSTSASSADASFTLPFNVGGASTDWRLLAKGQVKSPAVLVQTLVHSRELLMAAAIVLLGAIPALNFQGFVCFILHVSFVCTIAFSNSRHAVETGKVFFYVYYYVILFSVQRIEEMASERVFNMRRNEDDPNNSGNITYVRVLL